jgi:hypothetical protein
VLFFVAHFIDEDEYLKNIIIRFTYKSSTILSLLYTVEPNRIEFHQFVSIFSLDAPLPCCWSFWKLLLSDDFCVSTT